MLRAAGVVLDRGGQVTGYDFRRVVVQAQHRRAVRVQLAPVAHVANLAQGMRDHGHAQRVLRYVLGLGVAHERPALYVPHPEDDCEEV